MIRAALMLLSEVLPVSLWKLIRTLSRSSQRSLQSAQTKVSMTIPYRRRPVLSFLEDHIKNHSKRKVLINLCSKIWPSILKKSNKVSISQAMSN